MNEVSSIEQFWDAAADGVLQFQRCTACAYLRWPVAGVCPECLSREWQWAASTGTGTVWSYVVYHHAYRAEYRERLPYNVALVELDEGVRLLSRIVGEQPAHVGQRVQVTFAAIDGGARPVPVFAGLQSAAESLGYTEG